MKKTMEDIQQLMLQMVKKEVKPAIGCTEPVAVAFATATAHKYFKGKIESIVVKTSFAIYKNGKSVLLPGTEERGLEFAVAFGSVIGYPQNALCMFENIDDEVISHANKVLKEDIISVIPIRSNQEVFVDVNMSGGDENVHVILSEQHSHIKLIEVNGQIIFSEKSRKTVTSSHKLIKQLTFVKMLEIAKTVEIEDITFLLEGVFMNKFAAEQGLNKSKGFMLGASLLKLQGEERLGSDPSLHARILTASGADFRMGGGNHPVMTSGGSGNQGLGIILPIAVIAEHIGASDESLARALYFGHMINLFVKEHTGKLSALCGCAIAAGIGASASITWLLGGDDEQIAGAVKNMLANLTGMICDGAKESCSMKLSTSAGEAVISAYLAMAGNIVPSQSGIVTGTIENAIRNIGFLCEKGLTKTDEVLIDIISNNYQCI